MNPISLGCSLWLVLFAAAMTCGQEIAPVSLPTQVKAIFETHCLDCHGAAEQKGGLRLDTLKFDLRDPQSMAQ